MDEDSDQCPGLVLRESDEEADDSDRELQEAFKKGWIKPGLNFAAPATKKLINNVTGLKAKLATFNKESLGWAERLDITVDSKLINAVPETSDSQLLAQLDEEDDFKRELSFYKQAQLALQQGLPKLKKLGIPTKRPADYFAEMAKTDQHMKKVREKLVNMQQAKQKFEAARRMREERKFGAKVQKEVLQSRQQDKKRLAEAVKKHQKGVKGQLEDVLENRAPKKDPKKGKRSYKDEKFGFGGRKKGKKSNTAESYADVKSFKSAVHSKAPRSGQKKKKRLGKSKRKGGKKK